MNLKLIFGIAAVYMGLIGVGHLVAPVALSAGVVPPDASTGMVAFLRHYAALFISLAVLNWLARDSGPSSARNAIVTANITAFALAAVLDLLTVASGAGPAGLVPAVMNSALAIAFVLASRSAKTA